MRDRQPPADNRVNILIRNVLRAGLDYLAPERCLFCDQQGCNAPSLCQRCADALIANAGPCPRCALPDCGGALCPQCQEHPWPLASVTAPYVYDPHMAYLMASWKYRGATRLCDTAAALMRKAPHPKQEPEVLLATPLHWRKHLRRGFNQSQDLLLALRRDGIPRSPQQTPIALKRRAGRSQAGASRRDRLKQLQDAFYLVGDASGLTVTLIDDVCTTGATASAMATTLLEGGARAVHLWCLARTPARR